jgi:glutathione S-transferase
MGAEPNLSKVTIGYWDFRGLGERVKLLCEYLGIEYDVMIYKLKDEPNRWFKEKKI